MDDLTTEDRGGIATGLEMAPGVELRVAPNVWRAAGGDADRMADWIVEAYCLRWNVAVPAKTAGGEPCYVQYRDNAFGEWLAEDEQDFVPPELLLGHGWGVVPYDTRGGHPEPIGSVTYLEADDYGLRTVSLVDEEQLDLIRSGALRHYSAHTTDIESRQIGECDGLPLFEVSRARLVECGPTHDPSDPGARILSIGGEALRDGEVLLATRFRGTPLSEIRTLLGIVDEDRVSREANAVTAARRADVRELVRERQALAGTVTYHRGRALRALEDFRRYPRGEFMTAALEARQLAEDAADELFDLCCNDGELRRGFLDAAGAPPAVTMAQLTGLRR